MLKNEYILITGAAGSIGSELVRQLINDNNIFALDLNETELFNLVEELRFDGKKLEYLIGDICDYETLEESMKGVIPSYIFNAAAKKHVSPSEENPIEAVRTNILGLNNIIRFAKKHSSKLISISTDKAVYPLSVMGMTKRIGEVMVKNANGISVRFANVLGSRGSVIPIWQKQADEKKSLTITDSRMERYFMTIEQAVELVIEAAIIGEPGDTIILNMGQPIKILDLAKKIIQESGQDLNIKEIGIRPGESLKEELMTEEEKQKAIKYEKFYIIR